MVPEVSVIMAVHNGEQYLPEAVESILNQTFTDFEFIIVNDGSSDDTWQILQGYAARDPRIVLLWNKSNIGLTKSLNKGIGLARGKYIARMDADDISLPERLAEQKAFLDKNPEIGVLGSAVQAINGNGKPLYVTRFPSEHALIRWFLYFRVPLAHPTVMMRRAALTRVGGYSADMGFAQDYDLWQRLSRATRLSNLEDILLYLRRHEGCITRVCRDNQWSACIAASQRMICEVLREDVAFHVVGSLWNEQFEESNELYRAARLLYRLCQATLTDSDLSVVEKKLIRKDASERLFWLAFVQMPNRRTWNVFRLACRLDSLIIGRILAGKLRQRLADIIGLLMLFCSQ